MFLATSTITNSVFSKVKSQEPTTIVDPYWSNVVLLIQDDSSNGGTSFTDSKNGRTITRNGTPAHSTTSFPWGTSSILFDGTDDWLSLADNNDWDFGSSNFTIDFWFNPSVVSGTERCLFGQVGSDAYAPVRIQYTNSNIRARFRITGTGSAWSTGSLISLTVTTGTWYHVAVVRNGTSATIYANGIAGSPYNISTNSIDTSSETLKIGGLSGTPEGLNDMNGYMKGIRVTKNVARWTSNFTPPVGPYPTI